jgi:hypothetical protein
MFHHLRSLKLQQKLPPPDPVLTTVLTTALKTALKTALEAAAPQSKGPLAP